MKIKFSDATYVDCTNFNEQSVVLEGKISKWIATFVLKGVNAEQVSEMMEKGLFTNSFDVKTDDGELIASVYKYENMTSAFLRYRDEGIFTEIQLTKQIVKEVE